MKLLKFNENMFKGKKFKQNGSSDDGGMNSVTEIKNFTHMMKRIGCLTVSEDLNQNILVM